MNDGPFDVVQLAQKMWIPKSQLLDDAIKDLFKKYGVMDCSNDLNKSAAPAVADSIWTL